MEAYNRTIGSFESRVLVAARRFRELGASTNGEIESPEGVDKAARKLITGEQAGGPPEAGPLDK